jgi:hypothetical protein
MKLPFFAALAVVTGTGIATHADPDERPRTIDTSLERRIGNALRDLEIFNACALTVDARATVGTLERRIEDSLKPGRQTWLNPPFLFGPLGRNGCPAMIGLEGETTPPACAIAVAGVVVPLTGLVDVV